MARCKPRRAIIGGLLTLLLANVHVWGDAIETFANRPDLDAALARSGIEFLTPDTQAWQRDSFANPGLLWQEQGEALFAEDQGEGSCASCHPATGPGHLRGAAARYPQVDPTSAKLLNIEGRINLCRSNYQRQPQLAYESQALLALTTYVASLAQGERPAVVVDGPAAPHFQRGREYFFRRRGQLNLACNQCHDDHWGSLLRGDRLSQGHGNAFPAYRLEWQTLGSLHRRLHDCDLGVRAEPHSGGSLVYTELELYLAWRARSLVLESPGVRR